MSYLEEIKEKQLKYVRKVATTDNLFNDGISEVSLYDFSRANLSEESRVEAVTLIASACYANPNAIGRETLFNRLEQESLGLPSSSFEFIPVLLTKKDIDYILDCYGSVIKDGSDHQMPYSMRFGSFTCGMWLTNYRAVCADYAFLSTFPRILKDGLMDIRKIFNTEEECELIKKKFSVFLSYIDTNTRTQYIRHRQANWQEMSRRYVSGKKVDFQFYISERMKSVVSTFEAIGEGIQDRYSISTELLHNMCVTHYLEALKQGVEPQEARRVLPQSMYTLVWSGFDNSSLKNFFDLRLDGHAQWEIRKLAEAKLKLIGEN